MRVTVALRRLILSCLGTAVLLAAATTAVLSSRADDWTSLSLLGVLFVFAAGSELLVVEVRGLRLSGSFLSFALAMALLGPAPAAALAGGAALVDAIVSRPSFDRALLNVATYTTFSVLGGLAMNALSGGPEPNFANPMWFSTFVFMTFLTTNTLNFAMIAGGTAF